MNLEKRNSIYFVSLLLLTLFSCFSSINCNKFVAGTEYNQAYNLPSLQKNSNTNSSIVKENKKETKEDFIVYSGRGTEQIYLNMTREELLDKLGKPSNEYVHKRSCNYSILHWYPPASPNGSVNGDGIFAFLIDNKTFEIRFGKEYISQNGIKYGMSVMDLKTLNSSPFFLLTTSANPSTNNENLVFQIDKENGIAYEIGVGYKTKKRKVSAIYVFFPASNFLPWGCISENQTLIEINDSEL